MAEHPPSGPHLLFEPPAPGTLAGYVDAVCDHLQETELVADELDPDIRHELARFLLLAGRIRARHLNRQGLTLVDSSLTVAPRGRRLGQEEAA